MEIIYKPRVHSLFSRFPLILFLNYDFKFHSHCHHPFFAYHSFLTTTGKSASSLALALLYNTYGSLGFDLNISTEDVGCVHLVSDLDSEKIIWYVSSPSHTF